MGQNACLNFERSFECLDTFIFHLVSNPSWKEFWFIMASLYTLFKTDSTLLFSSEAQNDACLVKYTSKIINITQT